MWNDRDHMSMILILASIDDKAKSITWTENKLNVQIQNTKSWSDRRSHPRSSREHRDETETISAGAAYIS